MNLRLHYFQLSERYRTLAVRNIDWLVTVTHNSLSDDCALNLLITRKGFETFFTQCSLKLYLSLRSTTATQTAMALG
ncbi:hypothetical protein IMCC3135_15080 [Granulosicoccus antarcticus IMCC3135]|uniref:Uncharacterized protein n=1 Tax=Granulosicoccus antarcticus IMCC3135 TaxID=1192854 RepID=A0A2Z2NWA5_9GAMM|nr:hypothetical protein IMCC3135_15080 [Granulosicoccus antarcticus IMCC3135]